MFRVRLSTACSRPNCISSIRRNMMRCISGFFPIFQHRFDQQPHPCHAVHTVWFLWRLATASVPVNLRYAIYVYSGLSFPMWLNLQSGQVLQVLCCQGTQLGKCSESVQCAMLKACDAYADMGQS